MVETESWKDDITKFKISMEAPTVKEENGATFYLIRHGRSLFNHQWEPAVANHGWGSQEMQDVMNDGSLVDADLHPIGYLQCDVNAPKVHPINFTRVFVSPMNRALQTCIGMFKNHPNKANIKFVVLPFMREVYSTTNDIAIDCFEMMEKFKEGSDMACGLNIDFSNMFMYGVPDLWQTYTIADIEKQK